MKFANLDFPPQVIGKKYMKKVDCVILKFSKEIDAANELFETK